MAGNRNIFCFIFCRTMVLTSGTLSLAVQRWPLAFTLSPSHRTLIVHDHYRQTWPGLKLSIRSLTSQTPEKAGKQTTY